MNYSRPELRDRLAAEYVLGTLHGRARSRFQRLMKEDPALQAAVAAWERELMPMAQPLHVPMPPARVWNDIAARVAPRSAAPKPSWFERWFGARALGSLAVGLFVGLGVAQLLPTRRDTGDGAATQLPETYAGFLQDDSANLVMLISSLRHGRRVEVKLLQPITLAGDQTLVLWGLRKDAAPLLLGVAPVQGKGHLELPAPTDQLLHDVSELAASVETQPVTALRAPAQPFLLRGPCTKLW